jgi:hypothetical protein
MYADGEEGRKEGRKERCEWVEKTGAAVPDKDERGSGVDLFEERRRQEKVREGGFVFLSGWLNESANW